MRNTLFVLLATMAIVAFGAAAHAEETPKAAPDRAELQQEVRAQAEESSTVEAVPAVADSCFEVPGPAPVQILGNFVVQALQVGGQPCGGVICGPFEYCCNPTCNTCVLYGMECTMESCN